MTLIIDLNDKLDRALLEKPARVLRDGGTVVFPTETVYGLGANALDPAAAQKIFVAKGRPSDNPLIVHSHSRDILLSFVSDLPACANSLMDAFWPGPLTLIMKKNDKVHDIVTGGLNTVALRMPKHPVALALLEEAGVPLAAPSANVSGRPSPTRGLHVIDEMKGRVDAIVVSGDVEHGLESTVLDISVTPPVLLRPGSVTKDQIEGVIGPIALDPTLLKQLDQVVPKSPGMKYRHYAPDAEVYVLSESASADRIQEIKTDFVSQGKKVRVIVERDPIALGKDLFAWLRESDEHGYDVILIKAVRTDGVGLAVMNRLLKAAGHKVFG